MFPVGEDDVHVCEQQMNASGYQWRSEDSYQPSLHHTPSIQRGPELISSAVYIEDGQFEDANQ